MYCWSVVPWSTNFKYVKAERGTTSAVLTLARETSGSVVLRKILTPEYERVSWLELLRSQKCDLGQNCAGKCQGTNIFN